MASTGMDSLLQQLRRVDGAGAARNLRLRLRDALQRTLTTASAPHTLATLLRNASATLVRVLAQQQQRRRQQQRSPPDSPPAVAGEVEEDGGAVVVVSCVCAVTGDCLRTILSLRPRPVFDAEIDRLMAREISLLFDLSVHDPAVPLLQWAAARLTRDSSLSDAARRRLLVQNDPPANSKRRKKRIDADQDGISVDPVHYPALCVIIPRDSAVLPEVALACAINGVRLWLHNRPRDTNIAETLSQKHGLLWWAEEAVNGSAQDAKTIKGYVTYCQHMMTRWASDLKDCVMAVDALALSAHFHYLTEDRSSASFNTVVARVGIAAEKLLDKDPRVVSKMSEFYTWALNCHSSMKEKSLDSKLRWWLSQARNVAEKMRNTRLTQSSLTELKSIYDTLLSRNPACAVYAGELAVIELETALSSFRDKSPCPATLTHAVDRFNALQKNQQKETDRLDNIKTLGRVIMTVRKFFVAGFDCQRDDYARIFQDVVHAVDWMIDRSIPISDTSDPLIRLYPVAAEIQFHFANMAMDPEPFIENVAHNARRLKLSDIMKKVSVFWYKLASASHKNHDHAIATTNFEKSCATLEEHLMMGLSDKTLNGDDAIQTKVSVSRRYEALAVSRKAGGDDDGALGALKKAVISLPADSFSNFKTAHDGYLLRLLNQALRLNCKTENVLPIAVFIENNFGENSTRWRDTYLELLEYELEALAVVGNAEMREAVLRRIYSLVEDGKRPIRKARALVEHAKILKSQDMIDGAKKPERLIDEAIELLESESFGDDNGESALVINDLASAHAVLGMFLNGDSSKQRALHLKCALRSWEGLLNDGRNGLVEQRRKFRSIEATYHLMESLASYFGALGSPALRVQVLEIMTQMVPLRDDFTEGEDALSVVHADLSRAYISDGHADAAAASLKKSKMHLKDSLAAKSYWQLCYAHYLCVVGKLDLSSSALRDASQQSMGQKYLSAFAFHVKSNLSYAMGSLVDSIEDSHHCLSVLSSALDRKVNCDGPSDLASVHCLDGLSKWTLTERLLECHLWLGQLYLIQGSVPEAQHYLKQGLRLAESTGAKNYRSDLLLCLAEIDYRRGLLDESLSEIKDASLADEELETPSITRVIRRYLCEGEHSVRGGRCDEALAVFEEAEVVAFHANKTMPLEPAAVGKSIKRSATNAAKALGKLDPTISQSFTDLVSKTGIVLILQDRIDEAELKLREAEVTSADSKIKSEHLFVLAKLKFNKVVKGLSCHPLFDMFADSVTTLPWCLPSAIPPKKGSKGRNPLSKNIDAVDAELEAAIKMLTQFGSSQMLYEICHVAACAAMIRAYLVGGVSQATARRITSRCIYFLDQSRFMTFRRQITHRELKKNLRDSVGGRLKWPAPTSEGTADISAAKAPALQRQDWEPDTFADGISANLPSDWIVVSLSADPARDDLYLTRIVHGRDPVIIRLPIKRFASREGEDSGLSISDALGLLENLQLASRETIKSAGGQYANSLEYTDGKVETQRVSSKEHRAKWWKERKELDERLGSLLTDIESLWLGGFKGIFGKDNFDEARYEDIFKIFKHHIEQHVSKAVSSKKLAKKMLIDSELCRMLLHLGPEPESSAVEDAAYFLLDGYQYSGCPVAFDEINVDSLEALITEAIRQFHVSKCAIDADVNEDRGNFHLILVPDKRLHCIPWESLPSLEGLSISRMPSLEILSNRLATLAERQCNIRIDIDKTFYILNPGHDLVNTQRTFEGFLRSHDRWSGFIDSAPTPVEFAGALSTNDLVLYFGHGGGEQYIGGHDVRKLTRCAVTLLMGCSSGRLNPSGEFDPCGTPLNYLMAGCPALVANLWDVTDGDIDKLSFAMLESFGIIPPCATSRVSRHAVPKGNMQAISLPAALARARSHCKLRYLNGAAPVLYGLPVSIIMDNQP